MRYNLKKEYNWRGDVAELLAKYHYSAVRTKGYSYKKPSWIKEKDATFLKKHWDSIDLFSIDMEHNLHLYEVKARTESFKKTSHKWINKKKPTMQYKVVTHVREWNDEDDW